MVLRTRFGWSSRESRTATSRMRRALPALVIVISSLAGCTNPLANPVPVADYPDLEGYLRDPTGRNASAWPDLDGVTLTILDNGAFAAFDDAAAQFKALTGVTVKVENGEETGLAVKKLQDSRRSGKYDIVYGIDNMRYILAQGKSTGSKFDREDFLVTYKPALADRIDPQFVFFEGPWNATPVDHGYIALNAFNFFDEARNASVGKEQIDSLSEVRLYADQLVTQDPRTSSPGLGFLLMTVKAFGENPKYSTARYDWRSYWTDLFRGPDRDIDKKADGCVLVTNTWKEAYEQHFSGGYGVGMGGKADRAIVVSYSESPAIEAFFGTDPADLALPLVDNATTYHQIQTMAIANGTKNLHAAQAWIEFSLTDFFQELAAPKNAVYPVVTSESVQASVQETYQGLDPTPGSFRTVEFSPDVVAANYDRWINDWKELYEDPSINCGQSG